MSWLQELKVGDKVFEGKVVRTVEKRLQNHVIVDGVKFTLKEGRRVGGTAWQKSYITQWSQEAQDASNEQLRKEMLAKHICDGQWYSIAKASLKTLRELSSLMDKARQESTK